MSNVIDVSNGTFQANKWHQMVVEANKPSEGDRKHIYRVFSPGKKSLELKTDAEFQNSNKTLKAGLEWRCVKMSFSDVVNMTRILSLDIPNIDPKLKDNLKLALEGMTERAEEKYNYGLLGTMRKIFSAFWNLFTTDTVWLLKMEKRDLWITVNTEQNKGKLPFFIGDNAQFARLVAKQLGEIK